jgi:hypothetical protein
MMEAASTSETLSIYQATRHYNPEDGHLQSLQSHGKDLGPFFLLEVLSVGGAHRTMKGKALKGIERSKKCYVLMC